VRALNVGISTFVSVGNKADVSSNDLLAYGADDQRTEVVVLYLESFGNPRKFARIAPEGALLGLGSVAAVTAAVGTLVERFEKLGALLDGILLQREIPGGLEALVGVTTEVTFGPLVVCGLGGTLVEILHDVAFRLPPVTDLDAAEMLARLRATRLLDGYRGALPADRAALVSIIMRISALVEIMPELLELDLNPVKVLAQGQGAIVVDGRMRLAPLCASVSAPSGRG
jgi:acyl-CoA synthetase (NDP forming)